MMDQSKLDGRIAAAALRLAAERPWNEVSLRDIAEAAGSTLNEMRGPFGSKAAVLKAVNRAIDDQVLAKAPLRDSAQPVRDTLFEVMMSRFDAMQPYKSAIRSIMRQPTADANLVWSLVRSQHWMLQAAGIDTETAEGRLRVAGLASIYAAVFRTWLDDDDPGLARTMAALDRRLRSGERTMRNVEGVCGGLKRVAETLRETLDGARRSRSAAASAPAAGAGPSDNSSPATPAF